MTSPGNITSSEKRFSRADGTYITCTASSVHVAKTSGIDISCGLTITVVDILDCISITCGPLNTEVNLVGDTEISCTPDRIVVSRQDGTNIICDPSVMHVSGLQHVTREKGCILADGIDGCRILCTCHRVEIYWCNGANIRCDARSVKGTNKDGLVVVCSPGRVQITEKDGTIIRCVPTSVDITNYDGPRRKYGLRGEQIVGKDGSIVSCEEPASGNLKSIEWQGSNSNESAGMVKPCELNGVQFLELISKLCNAEVIGISNFSALNIIQSQQQQIRKKEQNVKQNQQENIKQEECCVQPNADNDKRDGCRNEQKHKAVCEQNLEEGKTQSGKNLEVKEDLDGEKMSQASSLSDASSIVSTGAKKKTNLSRIFNLFNQNK